MLTESEQPTTQPNPIAYMGEDGYPVQTIPSTSELYASMGSRTVRWERALEEAGRAIVGIPRTADRWSGARHDYNKDTYANIYKKVELVHKGINTTADHVLYNGFRVFGKDDENVSLITDWIDYIGLHSTLHDVVRHLMIYGDCFIEVVTDDKTDWGVVELKLIDPYTMFVYAHENGDIIGYIQHPKSWRWRSDPKTIPKRYRSKGRREKDWKAAAKEADPKAIIFDPDEIIHLKWNPMPSSYYGTSTIESMKRTLTTYIGMLQDVSVLIRRYGHPMIVWKIGSPEEPGSARMLNAFEARMRKRNIGEDPVIPGIIEWEVISAGEKSMNIEPYIRALRDDLFIGIAAPESVLGGTSSGASGGDEIRLEAFSRKIMEVQEFLSIKCKKELFYRVLGHDVYGILSRDDWNDLPNMVFNPPETNEQKYLRVKTGLDGNAYTIQEARVELGYPPDIPEGHERIIDLELKMADATARARQTGIPGETGPSKGSTRQADKTVNQTPGGEKPKEHD